MVDFQNSPDTNIVILHKKSPSNDGDVALKTGRQEVLGSNHCPACRPSRSGFFVVFSETRVNTG